MSLTESELHFAYKFANTPINSFPFPHLYVQDIFSDIFYSQIQKNLPAQNLMTSLPELYPEQPGFKNYKDRYVMDFRKDESINKIEKDKQEFWRALGNNFIKGNVSDLLRSKFQYYLNMRFKYLDDVSFRHEMQLINDKKNYSLGPHTDKPSKVISVLIYLPKDDSQKETGTSIYMPKDLNLLDKELPHQHYPHEHFHKVITMPFVPNSALCFIKTNNSYHGVEELETEDTNRWSLQYNLYLTQETLNQETAAKNKNLKDQKVKSSFSI
jgi:hypothetical protein